MNYPLTDMQRRPVTAPVRKAILPTLKAFRARAYAVLALVDLASLLAGLAIGSGVRFGDALGIGAFTLGAVLVPIFFALAFNGDAYGAAMLGDWRRGAKGALRTLVVTGAAVLFIGFGLKASAMISRVFLLTALASTAVLLVVGRYLFGLAVTKVIGSAPLARVLLIDGVDCSVPSNVHAFDVGALGLEPSLDDPMMRDKLGRLLQGADSVVVACPPERRLAWAATLKGLDVDGELMAPEISAVGGIGTGAIGGEATIVVAKVLELRSRLLKRGLDIMLATVALTILGPLMIIIAIAIRCESAGPILFVQQRLGSGNRLFAMYKFRSMRVERGDAAGTRSASRDDDRITRVGRLIRASSVDELPQLINILKGDMSFVGPRPHALGSLAGDQLFWEIDHRYWHRHAAKPGLTGLAQVRGFRGATLQRSDLVNRLQADLEYQSGWTLWRDISILFATLKVVVHKNAF